MKMANKLNLWSLPISTLSCLHSQIFWYWGERTPSKGNICIPPSLWLKKSPPMRHIIGRAIWMQILSLMSFFLFLNYLLLKDITVHHIWMGNNSAIFSVMWELLKEVPIPQSKDARDCHWGSIRDGARVATSGGAHHAYYPTTSGFLHWE